MKRKKILFFVQACVGGAERMTVLFAKTLNRQQYEVKFVVVPYGEASSSIEDFIPADFPIQNIGMCRPIMKMFRMFLVLIKEKPDFVFSSVINLSNKILPFSRLFPKTRFVIRCENYLFTYSRKQRLMVKYLYGRAESIIAQTKEMKDELVDQLKLPASSIVVLENPIDKETIDSKVNGLANPFPLNGKKHFVASGRFCYQKGFDILVRAFAELCKSRDDIDLHILGAKDGEYEREYERVCDIAREFGVLGNIQCHGYLSNPYAYVKCADCFVLSSRWEGLPNVLLESLYLGTPVAAVKCIPVIERIVENGKNGFCALNEDYVSLAKAMADTLQLGRVTSHYEGAGKESFADLLN